MAEVTSWNLISQMRLLVAHPKKGTCLPGVPRCPTSWLGEPFAPPHFSPCSCGSRTESALTVRGGQGVGLR